MPLILCTDNGGKIRCTVVARKNASMNDKDLLLKYPSVTELQVGCGAWRIRLPDQTIEQGSDRGDEEKEKFDLNKLFHH